MLNGSLFDRNIIIFLIAKQSLIIIDIYDCRMVLASPIEMKLVFLLTLLRNSTITSSTLLYFNEHLRLISFPLFLLEKNNKL